MRTCGALALRSPSSWKPALDGRPCPVSAPFLEPPRRCAQPRACARSPTTCPGWSLQAQDVLAEIGAVLESSPSIALEKGAPFGGGGKGSGFPLALSSE
eukprot:3254339-Pleurochrysis_carterae.AAC.1